MDNVQHVYGPVPSRRLGLSLGISPIPRKTCNYSCIYCQLGRTDRLTNTRELFQPVADIVAEFEEALGSPGRIDAVTIVGEGEPTLYAGLGELIAERVNRPHRSLRWSEVHEGLRAFSREYAGDRLRPHPGGHGHANVR